MKNITITRVTNGWIVRPFMIAPDWTTNDWNDSYVFDNIEKLQAALPKILVFACEAERTDPCSKS